MDIQTIILGYLTHQSMTGYDLKQKFSMSFTFFSGISFGSIYPALKKMEKEKLITTKLLIQEGAPNKKLCTITDLGRKRFQQALDAPLPEDKFKSAFLSRLFFFAHLDSEKRRAVVESYLEQLRQIKAALKEHQPVIETHADPFQLTCFKCGLRIVEDFEKNILENVSESSLIKLP